MKYDAREIRAVYDRGDNVMEWMRSREVCEGNSPTSILYSYDVQAGSYVARLDDPLQAELKAAIGTRLAPHLDGCSPRSLLEAGVGEATTLLPLLLACKRPPTHVFGFDLSLSRLLFAQRHLARFAGTTTLFTAALDRIPLADASVDLVFTFHAVEPNGGREIAVLRELLRVAARRLVMVEPSYELGSEATRRRIDKLGYVRGLPEILANLGSAPTSVERFGLDVNPLNEAALIVVDKAASPSPETMFISPISNRPLVRRDDCWFCPEDGHAFPLIAGVPCLMLENGILASKLSQF